MVYLFIIIIFAIGVISIGSVMYSSIYKSFSELNDHDIFTHADLRIAISDVLKTLDSPIYHKSSMIDKLLNSLIGLFQFS